MSEIDKQRGVFHRLALSVKDQYISDIDDEILKAADFALNHSRLREFRGGGTLPTTYQDYISYYQLIYHMYSPSLAGTQIESLDHLYISGMALSILNTSMSDSREREIYDTLLERQLIPNHVLEAIRIERECLKLRN